MPSKAWMWRLGGWWEGMWCVELQRPGSEDP